METPVAFQSSYRKGVSHFPNNSPINTSPTKNWHSPLRRISAIAQLAIYVPVLFASTVVVIRHCFHRQLGWIFLAILATVRIIGSGFGIAAVRNPHNSTDIEWGAVLQSVGISPLLLASLGLLKRIIDETTTHVSSDSRFQIPLLVFSVVT